ncbi:hypothetical protein [Nocardia sp. NPDC059239]|uniref:hypothetical protein n=1 Tax=unclassified Nocardia TaxID=2637762 RepID=UPI003690A72A
MSAVDAVAQLIAEASIAAERARADKWMKLGRKFDDIRDLIRACADTPEGHAEFYNECARIIFGQETTE